MVQRKQKQPLTPEQRQNKAQADYEDAVNASYSALKKSVGSRVVSDSPWDSDLVDELNIKYRKRLDSSDPNFKYSNRAIQSQVNHDIIDKCRSAYRQHGIVKTVIDLLSNFISRVNIFHPDPKWEQFYRAWAVRVELNERLNTFARDVFTHGQLFIYRTMADLSEVDRRNMRNAKGSRNGAFYNDGDALIIQEDQDTQVVIPDTRGVDELGDTKTIRSNWIPCAYTSLNPLQMVPFGSGSNDDAKWRFMLMYDDLDAFSFRGIKSIDEGASYRIPKDLRKKIRKATSPLTTYELEVSIETDRLRIIYDKKFDWEIWAVPMVYSALNHLKLKEKLRGMEARAADSVMTSMMLIKLGHIDNAGNVLLPPSDAVDNIGEMLREPGESTHLIWGTPDIEAEYIQPRLADIFNKEKIESIDADILSDLGASEVVVNGKGGGNYSNAFLSVAAMLERLDNIREKFRAWLMHDLRLIAKAVGDTKLPSVTFEISSLRDERIRNDFMLKLAQMGRLSSDTLWEYAGVDSKSEREKIKREQDEVVKGDMPPMKGPFKDQVADEVAKEQMQKDPEGALPSKDEEFDRQLKETEKMGEVQKKINPEKPAPMTKDTKKQGEPGRPPGTTNIPHSKKRDTKPKGMASIDKEKYASILPKAQKLSTDIRRVLYKEALRGAEVIKRSDLSDGLIQRVENEADIILSHADPDDKIDADYVKRFYTDGPAKLESCVKQVLEQKVKSYRKKNGKAPSAEQKKKMTSSAWAICRSQLGV